MRLSLSILVSIVLSILALCYDAMEYPKIMEQATPDEWKTHLKNIGWNTPDTTTAEHAIGKNAQWSGQQHTHQTSQPSAIYYPQGNAQWSGQQHTHQTSQSSAIYYPQANAEQAQRQNYGAPPLNVQPLQQGMPFPPLANVQQAQRQYNNARPPLYVQPLQQRMPFSPPAAPQQTYEEAHIPNPHYGAWPTDPAQYVNTNGKTIWMDPTVGPEKMPSFDQSSAASVNINGKTIWFDSTDKSNTSVEYRKAVEDYVSQLKQCNLTIPNNTGP